MGEALFSLRMLSFFYTALGDTEKFQALQTAYQEILSKRQAEVLDRTISLSQSVQEETVAANSLIKDISICLEKIKAAADESTAFAQSFFHFKRQVEKVLKKNDHGEVIKKLCKLLAPKSSAGYNDNPGSLVIDESAIKQPRAQRSTEKQTQFNQSTLPPITPLSITTAQTLPFPVLGVPYLETVTQQIQTLCTLCMKIPSISFRHGLATAINSKFV